MRLHRFFVKENIGENTEIEISEERIVHQVRNVFRLGVGDKIIIFDGSGQDYESQILELDKIILKLQILNSKEVFVPNKKVTLFLSLIKKENFELVCEKATELGVAKIVPVVSDRTTLKNLNHDRIEKILVEASEQCGRGDVPVLGEVINLQDPIFKSGENIFVADFGGEEISNVKLKIDNCSILIGPEGGWTEEERNLFKEKNVKTFSLGNTTLRAETAAIVATFLSLN
ncbi:MAG: rRNA (uracil1498-N3)-methyltransferase [Patescibacteria group bacterium]|jgi:16S rRNA (uracil1498-N3)-methyltransferase|nr:rRNA (uracil1498-N3)-methyltransferase [Patescibacteria group bacterium]